MSSIPFGIPQYENERDLTVEEMRDRVIAKFKDLIGKECQEFQYEAYAEKFIFAIAIHSIECWLLPLHCNDAKKAAKIKGCERQLKECLQKNINKTLEDYEDVSRKYSKPKEFKKYYPKNPSFKLFIEDIQKRGIAI